jgi:hypothetical protein
MFVWFPPLLVLGGAVPSCGMKGPRGIGLSWASMSRVLAGGCRSVWWMYGKWWSRSSQASDWRCLREYLCVCLGSAMSMECTAANWKFVLAACSLPYHSSLAMDTA